MKKRILSLLLVLLMVMTLVPTEVFAISPDDSSVLLKQNTDYTCTLCSAAMMLRRRAVIDGSSNWSSITENSIRSTAWDENAGLYWQFTYAGMSVGHYQISGSYQSKKDSMISLLSKHPEGIMIYDRDIPHAVLLTSYNSSSDTFYCADPAGGYPSGIIQLASSLLGRNGASQSTVISNIDDYWMITNRSGGSSGSETPSVSVTDRVTHGYSVKISADYLLKNYTSELDTNAESKNYVLKKDKAYSLSCSEKVVLSNGTVRYKWVSGDTPPKTLWFEYDSSVMSVSLRHQYTEYYYEAAHPHKYYKKCACGEFYYTGETEKLASCPECNPTGPVTYAVTGGNITFDKGTGTITDCDDTVTEANIPSKIAGVAVTSIGIEAFRECEKLTSVTIPSTVKTIHGRAFYDCKNLTGVAIANGVTSIGQGAFTGCAGLTSVAIPNSVTSIGDGAFSSCTNLKKVIIPDSIKAIDNTTFSNCTSLVSITIPNSVKSIGDRAFYNCTSLTGVKIPNGVTSIGQDAFEACTELTNVEIPKSITSIGDSAFRGCTSLISITIPNSVTSIAWYMFENCTSLMSVTIPNSVTSIGRWAFRNCTNLTSISLSDSVTEIGDSAFNGCKKLDYVYYSGSESQWNAISIDSDNAPLTSANKRYNICKYAVTGGNITFDKATGEITDCDTSVTAANIPSKIDGVAVTSIKWFAFYNCTNLTSVTIQSGVTSIDMEAFYKCENLTSVTIPNSVTSINSSAFSGCTSLKSINVANTNTAYCSVNGVLFNKDKIELIIYPEGKTEASYTIPNSVTSIGDRAFRSCTNLKSVAIPDSVKSIGRWAFYECANLTNITMMNGVISIGERTFCDCTSLTNISIPNSVTSIGDCAFSGCANLKSVAIPDSVKSIGKYAFYDCTSMTDVYYSGSETQWKNISGVDSCFDGAAIHFAQGEHKHSYTLAITAPTCTAAGYTTHTCSCGNSYKDNYTDALGHNYISGVCTRCNAKATDTPTPMTPSGFADVPSDAFYANAVKWAVENEITTGVGNNRFDPNGQCTRGQVVTFLWRAAGKPTVSANVSFSDVQPGAFYYEAVKWAVANGITTGVGGNRFAPNDTCTRGQVVTFLHRAANSPAASTISSFTDVPATAFYYNAVNWAVANGITSGVGNNRFAPNDTCTRGQVVTFLYRAQ